MQDGPERDAPHSTTQIGKPATAFGLWPLSWTQIGILFESEYMGRGLLYKVPYVIRWHGRLDPVRLESSLQLLVDRHAALQVRLRRVDGEWWQQKDAHPLLRLERAGPLRAAALKDTLRSFVERPFDLESAPLARALLVTEQAERHVLALVFHHLICDRWSIELLLRQLAHAYRGDLTPAPADDRFLLYCRAQRDAVAGGHLATDGRHWARVLDGTPPVTELRLSESAGERAFATGRLHLRRNWVSALAAVATQTGTTMATVLATVFTALIARLSETGDVVVGIPLAGRGNVQDDDVFGLFVNTVPLRLRLDHSTTFRSAIAAVHRQLVDAQEHQEFPFARLVRDVGLSRRSSSHPIFQHLFDWSDCNPDCELEGCRSEVLPLPPHHSPFDFALLAVRRADDVELVLEYAEDLLTDRALEVISHGLDHLVDAMCANVNLAIVPVVMARPSILEPSPVRTGSVVKRFRRWVTLRPDTAAVVAGDTVTTYGALGLRVTQLAGTLRHLGVAPGAIVALALGPGVDLIVGLLATLEAGGTFALLDPEDPPARRSGFLAAVAPQVVVYRGAPGVGGACHVLDLSNPLPFVSETPTSSQESPRQAAYIIATSGSSGRPRPVLVPNSALDNFVAGTVERLRLEPEDRVLQFCSVGFDGAIEEMLPTLCAGATVAISTMEMRYSVDAFLDWCTVLGVTVVDLPTAFWGLLGRQLLLSQRQLPPRLRLVVFGGEAARPEWLNAWQTADARDDVRRGFMNTYGPTEGTVVATYDEVQTGESQVSHDPPIGVPVSGTGAYVLDNWLQPVPVGVTGTLFLAGACLAAGYLGDAKATAIRFRPDPFAAIPGSRMYDTGDIASLDQIGVLHFQQRRDRQLKLQGHRVEPGEVESVLRTHRYVRDAAVFEVEDDMGGHVAAAVVCGGDLELAELRSFVAAGLPPHSRPTRYLIVDDIPMTSHGKVDHRALANQASNAAPYPTLHPGSTLENTLRDVFCRFLDRSDVSMDDDFLNVGGHSLAALRIVEELRRFGYALDVADLMLRRTVRAIAPHIRAIELRASDGAEAGHKPSKRLSDPQFGIWFEDHLVAGPSPYGIVAAFDMTGPIDRRRLEAAVRTVLDTAPVLRSTVVERDGDLFLEAQPAEQFALAVADADLDGEISSVASGDFDEDIVVRLARQAALAPFDSVLDLPVRAAVYSATGDRHVLVTYLHHLAADRDTERLFLEAVADAYAGRPHWASSEFFELEAERPPADFVDRAWWLAQLEGVDFAVDLPFDRSPPASRRSEGHEVRAVLSGGSRGVLSGLAAARGVTPFVVCVTAATCWLQRLTGSGDVTVGVAISRRAQLGSNAGDTLGPLFDVVPFRSVAVVGETFSDALARCRATSIHILAHGRAPVRELRRIGARGEANSLYQVLLDYENSTDSDVGHLGECKISRHDVPVFTSRADLEIGVRCTEEKVVVELRGRADVLESRTLNAWANSLAHFLTEALADPDAPITQIPLVARRPSGQSAERAAVSDILSRVDHWSREHPDRTAVMCGDRMLTYRQLQAAAAQVAHVVASTPHERPVGILLGRGPDLVAAVMGTWFTRRGFVLLDPAAPRSRLHEALRRLEPTLVLADDATLPLLGTLPDEGPAVVDVRENLGDRNLADDRHGTIRATLGGTPRRAPEFNGPAYICLTSGTSGIPKAVACSNRALVNLLSWSARAIPLGPSDVFLHIAAPGFDIALWEMFHPLCSGAQLLILPSDSTADIQLIAELLDTRGVTAVHMVPSVLRVLLDDVAPVRAESLRHLVCGGERLPPDLAARALDRLHVSLHHTYGPTEATVFVTHWATDGPLPDAPRLPLGCPVDGATVHVLDRFAQLLPTGSVGEICIGGEAVALGYLGSPGMTGDRFVPDPHGSPGSRLYRTGDRGRIRADGALEILGRADRQVKVDGVRVEPADVEAYLTVRPDVVEAAVTAFVGADERTRLVAFVVGSGAKNHAELRAHLASRFPSAYIPSVFVELEQLPRTAHGKVDLQALHHQPIDTGSASAKPVPPRNIVERQLLNAWQSTLARSDFGVYDNFFDLGGDSISAIRIVSRARAEGVVVRLWDVMRAGTVAELARLADVMSTQTDESPHWTDGSRLSPNQISIFAANRPSLARFTQSIAVEIRCAVTQEIVKRALVSVVQRHAALRQRFPTVGRRVVPFVASPDSRRADLVAFRVVSMQDLETLRDVAESAIDIGAGPTVAVLYTAAAAGKRATLHITVHHLAVDIVSWGIFLDDLGAALDDLKRGSRPASDASPCSIERWTATLACQEPSAAEAASWLQQLDPVPQDVPAQKKGRLVTRGSPPAVERACTTLDRASGKRLARRADELGLTLERVIIAAAILVFSRLAGRETVSVLLESHGRDHPDLDLSQTIGWISASFPVRATLPPTATMDDAVTAVTRALAELPDDKHGYRLLRNNSTSPLSLRTEPQLAVNVVPSQRGADESELLRLCDSQPEPPDIGWWPVGSELLAVEATMCGGGSLRLAVESDVYAIALGVAHSFATDLCHELDSFAGTTGALRVEAALAPLQAGMLSRSLAVPTDAAYHTQVLFELDGEVEEQALRGAWADVTRVVDAFRTAFRWADVPNPRQVIAADAPLVWYFHRIPIQELDVAWEALLAADRAESFNLSVAPLSRIRYVDAGAVRRLIWSHHHSMFDGWSLPLVTSLVGRAYALRRTGDRLQETAPSHLAFSDWTRRQDVAGAQSFWRQELAQLSTPTLLRRHGSGASTEYLDVSLSSVRTAVLQALARRNRTSLNAILLCAWALVVGDTIGTDDVVLGVVMSLRPPDVKASDRIIGLCMNTVPIRIQVSDDVSFADLVNRVQEKLLSAYPHAHLPLHRILAAGDMVGAPFDTLFVYENYPGDRTGEHLGNDGRLRVMGSIESTEYPWMLVCQPGPQIRLDIHHGDSHVDRHRARALADRLHTVLDLLSEPS